jgi:hypothetical protein
MLRLTLPCAQVAQECSPSAQVKAAAAHVQTLKQNQRKKKLSMTLMVVSNELRSMFVVNLANKKHFCVILDSINLPVVDTGCFGKLFSRGRHFNPDCWILALVLNSLIGIDGCVVVRLGPWILWILVSVSVDWPSHLLVNVHLLSQG